MTMRSHGSVFQENGGLTRATHGAENSASDSILSRGMSEDVARSCHREFRGREPSVKYFIERIAVSRIAK